MGQAQSNHHPSSKYQNVHQPIPHKPHSRTINIERNVQSFSRYWGGGLAHKPINNYGNTHHRIKHPFTAPTGRRNRDIVARTANSSSTSSTQGSLHMYRGRAATNSPSVMTPRRDIRKARDISKYRFLTHLSEPDLIVDPLNNQSMYNHSITQHTIPPFLINKNHHHLIDDYNNSQRRQSINSNQSINSHQFQSFHHRVNSRKNSLPSIVHHTQPNRAPFQAGFAPNQQMNPVRLFNATEMDESNPEVFEQYPRQRHSSNHDHFSRNHRLF